MRKIVFSALLSCILFGCSVGLGPFVSGNRQNLAQLQYGMTKEQVHAVMGQQTVRRQYSNPFRTALYRNEKGESIDVFYYWTDGSAMDGIQDYELTPVVFRSGNVIGWGRVFFDDFIKENKTAQRAAQIAEPVSSQDQSSGNKPLMADPEQDTEKDSDEEESWVVDPSVDANPANGIPMYPRSSCIGAVLMGVCKGEILHIGPVPKRCYGQMLNGKCTGKAY